MTEGERSYFRIDCELQIRFRKIGDDELQLFQTHAMRPSPYSVLRFDLENQISRLPIRDESKSLFEKAFQLLINIDQRLERIEEQIQTLKSNEKSDIQSYEWINGNIGAGGVAFQWDKESDLKNGDYLLVDLLLAAMPEYRVVCAAKVVHAEKGQVGIEFISLHSDDREFIHRFVMSREREILRSRAEEKS